MCLSTVLQSLGWPWVDVSIPLCLCIMLVLLHWFLPRSLRASTRKGRFMLRQLIIKNFVKFEKEQEFQFEKDGAYFLIGSNQTGKSSIFEAIGRCMSIQSQKGCSNRPDNNADSIVVCKFKNETDTIYSYYIRKPEDRNNVDIATVIKGCVLLDSNGEVQKHGMDEVTFQGGKFLSQQIASSPGHNFPNTFSLQALHDWIKQIEGSSCSGTFSNTFSLQALRDWFSFFGKPTCEAILNENIDNIVFVFPMRGIGSRQWSKSPKIGLDPVCQNAEIITWYLKKTKDKQIDKDEYIKREQRFYDFITNTKNVTYEIDETRNTILVKDFGPKRSILRQSEGLLEAKFCSILLADPEFSTVIFDTPGYGMHPQMIDRLCTILTEEVKDKVVISTTHNTGFLKPWLMENIFYFRSNKLGKECQVTSGKVFAENADLKHAIPGSVTMDQFANFCSAETIVFVEGVSDQAFLEALARHLRNTDFDTHMLFSSLQFVGMGGRGKTKHFRKCCKILNKRYAFVLDGDIRQNTEKTIANYIEEDEEAELCKKIGKKQLGNRDEKEIAKIDLPKLSKIERENHFFFWDFKDLEDVFFHGLEGNTGENKKQSGVLKEIKDKQVPLPPEMQDILKKCFPIITFGFEDNLICTISKKITRFKLFLDGDERFEDRIQLFDFLLKNAEASKLESVEEIHKLINFLLNLGKNRKVPVPSGSSV